MITPGQRKKYFVLQRLIGETAARQILADVTKGINSLRDCQLTPWKMSWVLHEMVIKIKKEKKKQVDNLIILSTPIQEEAIRGLIAQLEMTPEVYTALCRSLLRAPYPVRESEADTIIRELLRLQKERGIQAHE